MKLITLFPTIIVALLSLPTLGNNLKSKEIAEFPLVANYFEKVSLRTQTKEGHKLLFASGAAVSPIPEDAHCENQSAQDVATAIFSLDSSLVYADLADSLIKFIGHSNFEVCQKASSNEQTLLHTYFIAHDNSLSLEMRLSRIEN